jgi:hypothetical protein
VGFRPALPSEGLWLVAVFADISNVRAMYPVGVDANENVANTSGEKHFRRL